MRDTTLETSIPLTSSRGATPGNRIQSQSLLSFVRVLAILVALAVVMSCGQSSNDSTGGDAGDSGSGESSNSESRRLTVEEYVQHCTGAEIRDYDTVYELVDALREGIEKLQKLNPPRELMEYHDATIKRGEAMITASRRLPGAKRPNEYMFHPDQASELYRADDHRNFILFDLDSDVRNALRSHGCID